MGKEYDEDERIIYEGTYREGERYNGKMFKYLNTKTFCFSDISGGMLMDKEFSIKKLNNKNEKFDNMIFTRDLEKNI